MKITLWGLLLTQSLFLDSQATELAGGQIITRTNVEHIADMAKDIRDMSHECFSSEQYTTAKNIYQSGKNTEHTLSSLSLKEEYQSGWTFGIQKYGMLRGDLSHDSLTEWDEKLKWFGHDYVMTQFEEEDCSAATQAALVLNVWMMASHELWEGWDECRRLSNPNYYVDFDPNEKADDFIAYWVGALQKDMADMGGHSLFSITNEVGQFFDTVDRNGVAWANSAIVSAYEEASAILSKSDACTQDDAEDRTIQELWKVYHVISSQMMVPLMQHLLKAMVLKDSEAVRLYATIVVPQTSQCRTSTFETLKSRLLDRPYENKDFMKLYQSLISTFDCLGISCDDIGVPNGHSVPVCYDSGFVLAEYMLTDLRVQQIAKIDLDVHQMEIMMKLNEHEMARHMYLYGKNSLVISENEDDDNDLDDDYYSQTIRERMSLHSLALSNERRGVMYKAFLDYHDDVAYSDKIILQILEGEGKWGSWSADYRAKIISDIIRVQVVYMVITSKLEMAVTQCSDLFWDEAAALIIGNLEGKERGGSKDFRDGKLLWSLANRRGLDFQRLNHENYAVVNGSIENLLFSGRGKIIAGSCANLGYTAQRISHLLLIPVIQSVVKYAISNEFVSVTSAEVEVALGEVNANVLIPIFTIYDSESAKLIKRNMVATTFGILVESGPQAVADAYLTVAESFGIECDYIGVRYEVDGCANYKDVLKDPDNEDNSSVSLRKVSHFISSLIASFALCLLF